MVGILLSSLGERISIGKGGCTGGRWKDYVMSGRLMSDVKASGSHRKASW